MVTVMITKEKRELVKNVVRALPGVMRTKETCDTILSMAIVHDATTACLAILRERQESRRRLQDMKIRAQRLKAIASWSKLAKAHPPNPIVKLKGVMCRNCKSRPAKERYTDSTGKKLIPFCDNCAPIGFTGVGYGTRCSAVPLSEMQYHGGRFMHGEW